MAENSQAVIPDNLILVDGEIGVPSSSPSDAGKVLTVDSDGSPEWADATTELPTVTGNAGKILTVNSGATGVEWADAPAELPASLGTAGQVLTVNSGATGVEWASVPTEIPSISGNSNKVLKVNAEGTAVEWAIDSTETTYTAGNMISLANDEVAVSTTAGITDIQIVNALPASPVATVLYLIQET